MSSTTQLAWHIQPQYESILRPMLLEEPERLRRTASAALYKDGTWQASRLQVTGAAEGRAFWLLTRRRPAKRIRPLWRRGTAGELKAVLAALEPLAIELPRIVALAGHRDERFAEADQMVLASDGGPDVVEQLWALRDDLQRRRSALRKLGTALGEIHRRRVRLSQRGLADLGLCWKDLGAAKPAPAVTVRQLVGWRRSGSKPSRLRDLSLAVFQLQSVGLSRTDWMRLAQGYIGPLPSDRGRRKETLRRLLRRIRRYLLRADARFFADGARGGYLRRGAVWVHRDSVSLVSELPIRNLKEAMTAEIGQPLDKPGLARWRRRSRVTLRGLLGGERVLYLKRFRLPPAGEQLRRLVRGPLRHSTAWVEWRNILRLQAVGVPTMRPVLFAERMRGVWEAASLIATEQVPGESLERWLPAQWRRCCERFGRAWRSGAVVRLAGLVRRLHAAGLCHRDLYTSHIFVMIEPDRTVRFHVIDLQRMFAPRWRHRRWYIKDLAALAATAPAGIVSRTDRLRFLLAYLGRPRLDPEAKRWWRDVARKAGRMMRHHEARMRRLAAAARAEV